MNTEESYRNRDFCRNFYARCGPLDLTRFDLTDEQKEWRENMIPDYPQYVPADELMGCRIILAEGAKLRHKLHSGHATPVQKTNIKLFEGLFLKAAQKNELTQGEAFSLAPFFPLPVD